MIYILDHSVLASCSLTFSGSDYMEDFDDEDSVPWKRYRGNIKTINLEKGIDSIGDYAFYGVNSLRNIDLPDTIYSIGESAFYGCTYLRGICFRTAPGDNQIYYIYDNAFSGCTSMRYVSFPKKVYALGIDCFKGCTAIKDVYCNSNSTDQVQYYSTTSSFNRKKASEMATIVKNSIGSGAPSTITSKYGRRGFAGNDPATDSAEYTYSEGKLTLTTPDEDTSATMSGENKKNSDYPWYDFKDSINTVVYSNISNIGPRAFQNYTSIKSLRLESGKKCNPDIGFRSFQGCKGITELNISTGNIDRQAFLNLTNLSTLTLNSSGDISNTAFMDCTLLTTVTITKAETLDTSAFYRCPSLTSVDSGGTKTINKLAINECGNLSILTIGNGATSIEGCPVESVKSLTKLSVDKNNKKYKSQNDKCILTKDEKTFVMGIGDNPSIPYGVKIIGKQAFYNDTALSMITIPVTVNKIEDEAFQGCVNLKKVIYPSSQVEWDKINISATNNNPLLALQYSGIEFYASEGDFENGKLHWKVDNAGTRLSITQKTAGTITISDFASRSAVPWGEFAGSITEINAICITSVGAYAFSGCTNVTNADIHFGDLIKVGDHAFENCNGLTSLEHIQSASLTSIGSYAFANCYGLKEVELDGVGTALVVNPNAFSNCLSLKKFNSGDAKTLKAGCLNGCSFLEEVTIGTTCISISAPLSDCGDSIEKYAVAGGETFAAPDGSCITKGTELVLATNKADIPNSVTTIGAGAFSYLSSMESVTIQNTVTSIEENAFNGCSGLRYVNFIGSEAEWNTLARNIAAGNDPLKNVEKRFAVQSGDIDVSGGRKLQWNIDNVTKALTITVTNGTVTEIPSFESADQVPWAASASIITSVEIPATITSIGDYAFYGFKKITNDGFTVESGTVAITEVGDHAFEDCDGLTAIISRDNLTKIGAFAFSDCDGIAAIPLNATSTTDIGEGAFASCGELSSIGLPNTLENVGAGVLKDCDKLTEIRVDNGTYYIGSDNKMLIEKKNGKSAIIAIVPGVTSLTFPDGTTEISASALAGCEKLATISIPGTVESIGDGAFEGCSALTEINIPASVTTIGSSVFEGCESLATITVAEGNQNYTAENNAIIENATGKLVAGCNGTEAIPADTKIIGEGAFKNCSKNTLILGISSGVTEIEPFAFYGCIGLTEMSIPESVNKIGESAFEKCVSIGTAMDIPSAVTVISKNTFRDCASIPEATLSEKVTELEEGAFRGCASMEKTNFPDAITAIPDYAYQGCISLKELTLPQSLVTIGQNAFEGCSSVETVMIPWTVTSIDTNAFFGDNAIKKVNYQGMESEWNKISIGDGNDPIKNASKTYEYMMKLTGISVSPKESRMQLSDTLRLSVSYSPAYIRDLYKKVTWTSDNPDVASVDDSGVITANSVGNAKITAKSVKDPSLSDVAEITVVSGYTVTYKSNYEGGADDITEAVKKDGEISLKSDMFKRDGFMLSGWKDSEGSIYTADQSGIKVNKDMTFYAQWTENKTDPEGSGNKPTALIKKPFTIKGADGDIPIEMYVEITKTISYNGMKHVPQGSKVNKSTADDIVVSVSGNILDYVDQSKTKIKVKNNKFVSASGKPAQVIISFKPNGKDKSIKKGIKEINKALKNDTELSFEIVPLDLSTVSNLTVKTNGKKTKVSKVNGEVMVSGTAKAVKLGKKDFTAEINADAGTVTLTGQGNCTGKATVPLS